MKKILLITSLFFTLITLNSKAQKYGTEPAEQFGRTLNLGAGVGYYGYTNHPWSALMINYEIGVARNITLAPFVGFSTYTNRYYWGNKNYPYRYYSYRETSFQFGVKGLYYFDELLHAGSKWDFYIGASIGFETRTTSWDYTYYGDQYVSRTTNPLYVSGHLGTRFHITQKVGLFLDLSSSFSTFGLSVKL